MNRNIGTPVPRSDLEQGSVYYLKHKGLGEAVVEYQGGDDFLIVKGKLHGERTQRTWVKGQTITIPETIEPNFYRPAI